ncbi:MAG: PAS domain S-box protein, partial [Deltaproteobacteria bacterium]|nr:PAS domain S-box protein [Deltaproteobacteria bacterium]
MRIVKWVVLPIVVAVLAGYAVHTAVESFILDRAKRDVRDVLLSHRGVHLYIQRTMHPEFYRARASASIQKDYYAPEILSSSFTVRVLHGYYNEERKKAGLPPVYYKLAALNPRNPVNAADPAEERLLRYFRDHPEEKEYHAVEKIGGTPYLVFAMPFLRNAAPCLRCHGRPEDAPEGLRARYPDDAGYGEKLGDLRAVESLRVPIAGERFATWAATLAVFAGLGTICALFVFNGFLGRAVRNRTAELSASEERWKFALEGAGDGIWDWNVVTDAAFFSERSRAIFRSDGGVERTFGEWEKRVHPDDAAARRGALERHLRGETEVYESEHRLRGDDGEYRWILARGKVMERSPAGAPLRVMGTHRDVTAQRQAQDELRESEEKFRAIFDGMTDGDLAVDPETRRCVEGNRAACEMLGYEREELLALRVDDLHPPEELPRVLEAFGRLARGEQATSPELVMRRKDGSTFFAEVRSGPMALRGRPVLNAVIRDVSERRAAALEREKLEAQLAQAQKLETVGRLAGGVAHDFNNMLSVIMGQADLAQLRLDPADPLHAQLSEILKAAGRSADLTRQLLGFARKQTINPRVLDLNEAVTGTLSMLRRLIGEDVE